jgi:hypothetical protein
MCLYRHELARGGFLLTRGHAVVRRVRSAAGPALNSERAAAERLPAPRPGERAAHVKLRARRTIFTQEIPREERPKDSAVPRKA